MHEHQLSLEPLSFKKADAFELLSIAGGAGFDLFGLTLQQFSPAMPADAVVVQAERRALLLYEMRLAGIGLNNIECFDLGGDTDMRAFAPALECGHALGARGAIAIASGSPERRDVVRRYRSLCDMAADFDMRVHLEFLAIMAVASLQTAAEVVRAVARPNAGVLVDLLHLIRTGGTLDDLAGIPVELIGAAQLCDGPAIIAPERMREEMGENRKPPGEGDFPVTDFLRRLPPDIVVGVEVPQASSVLAAPARAQALYRATKQAYRRGSPPSAASL